MVKNITYGKHTSSITVDTKETEAKEGRIYVTVTYEHTGPIFYDKGSLKVSLDDLHYKISDLEKDFKNRVNLHNIKGFKCLERELMLLGFKNNEV